MEDLLNEEEFNRPVYVTWRDFWPLYILIFLTMLLNNFFIIGNIKPLINIFLLPLFAIIARNFKMKGKLITIKTVFLIVSVFVSTFYLAFYLIQLNYFYANDDDLVSIIKEWLSLYIAFIVIGWIILVPIITVKNSKLTFRK